MLFDIHDDPVDGKRARKPARRPPATQETLPAFRPLPSAPTRTLGQIEDTFECLDERCLAMLHDIIDEYAGAWSIQCVFCGTGQRVKAIRGHIQPKKEEFVFASGDYAGMAISDVAADPRGLAYIEWAAEDHKSQPVKDACKTFLDSLRPAP